VISVTSGSRPAGPPHAALHHSEHVRQLVDLSMSAQRQPFEGLRWVPNAPAIARSCRFHRCPLIC
jgi:hypothetical protein